MLYAGGSFGRRATPTADVASRPSSVAKAIGGRAPVKLVWTREDDMRAGRYRPLYSTIAGRASTPAADWWPGEHRIVGQSILAGTPFEGAMVKNGIDATSVEGAVNLPYAIPNCQRRAAHHRRRGARALVALGRLHAHRLFDRDLPRRAGARPGGPARLPPVLLKNHPRHGRAEAGRREGRLGHAGAARPRRGIAVHESFNTFVAQVAEVSLGTDGGVKVERVVCAVDCGIAINPDVVRAQMEGGIGFALCGALTARSRWQGRVQQSNFDGYPPLRIDEMPEVEVHIVPSTAAPTGVGEPGVPPIGAGGRQRRGRRHRQVSTAHAVQRRRTGCRSTDSQGQRGAGCGPPLGGCRPPLRPRHRGPYLGLVPRPPAPGRPCATTVGCRARCPAAASRTT